MFQTFKSYKWGTWIRVVEMTVTQLLPSTSKELYLYLGLSLLELPSMEKSLAEMSTMTLELQSLCSLLQESKEEAIRTLQQKM